MTKATSLLIVVSLAIVIVGIAVMSGVFPPIGQTGSSDQARGLSVINETPDSGTNVDLECTDLSERQRTTFDSAKASGRADIPKSVNYTVFVKNRWIRCNGETYRVLVGTN